MRNQILQLDQLSKNLRAREFESEIFNGRESACQRILELAKGRTVGYGSSLTLEALGLHESLKTVASSVFHHVQGSAGATERDALVCDLFLTSANAISMGGQIINIDGTGNRVAATCFGPKKLVFVIGTNMISDTLETAMLRATDAAVELAKRLGRKTPCTISGKCEDCQSPECICSITTIHRRKPRGLIVSILLITESLGI